MKKIVLIPFVLLLTSCTTFQGGAKEDGFVSEAQKEGVGGKVIVEMPDTGGTKSIFSVPKEEVRESSVSSYEGPPCNDPETGRELYFSLSELESKLVPVSNAKVGRIVAALKVIGVTTLSDSTVAHGENGASNPSSISDRGTERRQTGKYSCKQLPVFYSPKSEPIDSLTSVLSQQGAANSSGYDSNATGTYEGGFQGTPDGSYDSGYGDDQSYYPQPDSGTSSDSKFAFVNMSSVDFSRQDSLIAFYHPEVEERLDNISNTINKTIDAAPLQVYIESMVLEVNEEGMDKLGVLYTRTIPGSDSLNRTFTAGLNSVIAPTAALTSASSLFSLDHNRSSAISAVTDAMRIQIDALIAEGSAEVLSRPSVMALNNRPAVIVVGEQKHYAVREAKAAYGATSSGYSFKEVTPGILLQLRPRISEVRNEVSMEIDVQVRALVASNDGQAMNEAGTATVATKPGTSSRRVHTFAMVPDKTPIIIGGLVSKNFEETNNKLPLLGDIPVIGNLFGADSSYDEKKEVIVVITPHIVEDNQKIGVHTPKDTAMFDDVDMTLFRDSYRLRSEDIFDLDFIYQSEQFKRYRKIAMDRLTAAPELAKEEPYRKFSENSFPGADALVSRMLYDVVKKQNLADAVALEKVVLAKEDREGGFDDVAFLEDEWRLRREQSEGRGLEVVFSANDNQERAVQAYAAIRTVGLADIVAAQDDSIKLKDRTKVLIKKDKDLDKLRAAIMVREIMKINGGNGRLNIADLRKGKKLTIPVVTSERHHLLDQRVAEIYLHINNYYRILEKDLRDAYVALEADSIMTTSQ